MEPKIVSYKNTLDNLLIESVKGKYFQNILNPNLILCIPEKTSIDLIENNTLSAWFPFQERLGYISLKEFKHYAEISEEQFKEYEKNKETLSNLLLVHKDTQIFKKDNKANLSA